MDHLVFRALLVCAVVLCVLLVCYGEGRSQNGEKDE